MTTDVARGRNAPFRQADVTRALKAVRSAGEQASQIVIAPSGEIRVELSVPARAAVGRRDNDFDREFGR